jgi:hypothetical protein
MAGVITFILELKRGWMVGIIIIQFVIDPPVTAKIAKYITLFIWIKCSDEYWETVLVVELIVV